MKKIKRRKTLKRLLFVALLLLTALFGWRGDRARAGEPVENPDSCYGVCAHLSGDSLAPEKLKLMSEIGIRWARADVSWGTVDQETGTYQFETFDRLFEEAERNGVCLLPILSQKSEKKPTSDYLKPWGDYIRATVERYKEKHRYWEVVNEPNLDMLHGPELPPREYAKLLKEAYRIIKGVDPELIVVHGGLAGTPCGYLSEEFSEVSDDFFDVMNVHCYRGGMRTRESIEWFEGDIRRVRELLDRNGAKDKPIWITETGWSALPEFGEMYNMLFKFGLRKIFGPDTVSTLGYLWDKQYGPSQIYQSKSLARMLPTDHAVELSLDDLAGITPEKCAAILLPPGEAIPSPRFDDLFEYVRQGGFLIQFGGIPFRHEVEQNAGGVWIEKAEEAPETFRKRFALAATSHTIDAQAPKIAINRVPKAIWPLMDSRLHAMIDGFGDTYQSTRFLSPKYFEEAESATIVLTAENGDFSAPTVAIVQPAGCRGGIFVGTINELETTNICTLENQAVYLPQNILIARTAGAAKVFWYEFQSTERNPVDKESFFGLTHADLSPKPAFAAYRTLISAIPDGSSPPKRRFIGDAVAVDWTLPDGRHGYAFWTPNGETTVSVRFDGKIESAFDYLGSEVTLDGTAAELSVSPKVLYVITSGEKK